MKNVKSETALKFGVGIYRNNSERKSMNAEERKMMDMHEKREKLQEYLREPGCTPIMCAYDVLSAKLIENAGFPIVYTGSFITGASQFGMADVGLVQLNDSLN